MTDRWSAQEALAEALEADAEAVVDPEAFGLDAEEALDLQAALSALRGVAAPDDEPPTRALELPEGERIGNYELLERLGVGGFAAVYRARDPVLDVEVAIKLVSVPPGAQAEVQERFEREARTVARLEHRHVVRVRAAGVDAERPYLVMDLVVGDSLQTIVDRDGPLPAPEAARIARDLADALEAAHAQGILHRDVKPDNVLLDDDRVPRLTDFGLALDALAEGDQRLTQEGHYLGTPGYWPPEQAHGDLDAISSRSDLYGLGATLYALLTGRPPFVGRSVLATLESMARAFPPPSELANVPPGLEAICLRCLERDPADRYPSAAALRADLEAWLADPDYVPAPRRRQWALASLTAIAGVALLALGLRPATPPPPASTAEVTTAAPLPPPAEAAPATTATVSLVKPGWKELAPAGKRPRARFGAACTYDPIGERTLVYGGTVARESLPELWAWDGERWALLDAGSGPLLRAGASATYDTARRRLFVAGTTARRRGRRALELWEHDGKAWTAVTPPPRLKRRDMRVVYDPAREQIVLVNQRQVWTWDGQSWRPAARTPATRGPLAWSESLQVVLLLDGDSAMLWGFNGDTWRVIAHPPPTTTRGFALFGTPDGALLVSKTASTVWTLRKGLWVRVAHSGPVSRTGAALSWDQARRRLVVFGGAQGRRHVLADLWELTLPAN